MQQFRSSIITDGVQRAAQRSLLYSVGLRKRDFNKPFIGIASSFNDIVPGSVHQRRLVQEVKQGITSAGGVPFEFNTVSVCDGLAHGHQGMYYPLISREVISDSIETMVEAHAFDGVVFLASCGTTVPAMLMAAARLDLPSIIMSSGSMRASKHRDKNLLLSNLIHYVYQRINGEIDDQELSEIEQKACQGHGKRPVLGTAGTMSCLGEVLGMSMAKTSTMIAETVEQMDASVLVGRQTVELVRKNIKPSDIMTKEAFINAMKFLGAINGSPNAVIHLIAIAKELNIDLDLKMFDELSKSVPIILAIDRLTAKYTTNDLGQFGGVPAVLKSLGNHINQECLTVTGRELKSVIEKAEIKNNDLIRSLDNPIKKEGSIAVFYGNISPEGAVANITELDTDIKSFKAEARVYDSIDEALDGIMTGDALPDNIIVVRYEGPVGGPGMREVLSVASLMEASKFKTPLITDGRFSDLTYGPNIGHVSPEAAVGGPIGIVQNGDTIEIDIEKRTINLLISDDEYTKRLTAFVPKEKENKIKKRSVVNLYKKLVTSASNGAILK